MNLTEISVKRPTFMMSVVLSIIMISVISYFNLGVELFPETNLPMIQVQTVYRGAGAQEVESQVSKPIEDEISSLTGLKHLSSVNMEGVSIVLVEFTMDTDVKWAEQQLREKVTAARAKIPKECDATTYKRFDMSDSPVMVLAMKADLSQADLYDLADKVVKPALQQVDGVGMVMITGGAEREIAVDLDRAALKEHELSVGRVAGNVASGGVNVPVGSVAQAQREESFRTLGEYRDLERIRQVPVSFYGGDTSVTVGDLGEVREGVEDVKSRAFLNGKTCLVLQVFRQGGTNTVEVNRRVVKALDKLAVGLKGAKGAPEIKPIMDMSDTIGLFVDDVARTIFEGVLLTVLVVFLFLGNVRSTLVNVAVLFASLVSSFVVMKLMGFSINVITLIAMSLSVGLLIDDSIVVLENIWKHIEEGMPPIRAALQGTKQVTMAVLATTLAIVAVFAPISFISGMVGIYMRQLGLTVAITLLLSLFNSLTLAPLLFAYLAKKPKQGGGRKNGPLARFLALTERLQGRLAQRYDRLLRWCLGHRLAVLGVCLGALALCVPMFHLINTTLQPAMNSGFISASVELPQGTSLEATTQLGLEAAKAVGGDKNIDKVILMSGSENRESNVFMLLITMVPFKQRTIGQEALIEKIRGQMAHFTQFSKTKVSSLSAGSSQSPITLYLMGDDLAALEKASAQVEAMLAKMPDLVNVDTTSRPGKPELQVALDPVKMRELGVSGAGAGMELRAMVDGVAAAKYRVGVEEYDIRVRLKEGQRDLREGLDKFWVPNMNGNLVRVSSLGKAENQPGNGGIRRRDRVRTIHVTADLAKGGSLGRAQKDINAALAAAKLPDGVKVVMGGSAESMNEFVVGVLVAMALSVVFVFLVLASLYESLVMPLLIMVALPMAVVGALLSLVVTGQQMDMFAMIGMVLLMGLVVKNSILLVDLAMQLIRQGMPRREAIAEAGKQRLRPILMTTMALIAGMVPMALGRGEIGTFRQGMGIVVIGGLLSSTLLTLLVVPSLYEWLDDFRLWTRRVTGRGDRRLVDMKQEEIDTL